MSFRKEKKFRVTVSDFQKFKNQLYRQGMKNLFEQRIITSIYFDTVDLNMFHDSEEGVLPRKKVRIRWYNNLSAFSLENKISSIEGRFKTTSKLENINSEDNIIKRNLFDKHYGHIQPTLKVSYQRSYFIFKKMRVTFDKNINYQNLKHADERKYYDPERVIEVKIPVSCPDDFFEKIIPHTTARFSKYSRGLLLSSGELSEV